jgi:carboxylate-amine ligase
MTVRAAWARWSPAAAAAPWTVGIEEEVMLLDPDGWALASRSDEVLAALPEAAHVNFMAETHGSALELATQPHGDVPSAARELHRLRAQLAAVLEPLGMRAAVSGTHPFTLWEDVEVSPGPRYQFLHNSLRALARREPTFGLHVHVAVPEPEQAVRAFNRMRAHLPVLLALSGNSPFWQGRDTGLCSMRTPLFQAFPRVGIPRAFADYAGYVGAIDVLVRSGAIPEPTFLWWDVRLQPRFGTLEVRIMDAQTRVADTATLVALVQCLVRSEALDGHAGERLAGAPEVLEENRFIATRDGMSARLVDPERELLVPVLERLERLVEGCTPHAAELGCVAELASVATLARAPGADRQRACAGVPKPQLGRLMRELHADFASAHREPAVVAV